MAVTRKKTSTNTLKNLPLKVLNSILNTSATTFLTRFLYLGLLLSFLAIGYLYGKVQTLENSKMMQQSLGSSTSSTQASAQTVNPTQSPQDILKKLDKGHLPPDGNVNAKVTIIEFSDFQCPFCANYYKDTLPKIRADYITTGKVKIYYRHLPLAFHPKAKPLAIASECANDQGKFWEMHDKIFENHDDIESTDVETHKLWAQELGLDPVQFNNCVESQQHTNTIDEDTKVAGELGVTGTPGFFINGRLLMGAQPYEVFKSMIDEELAK